MVFLYNFSVTFYRCTCVLFIVVSTQLFAQFEKFRTPIFYKEYGITNWQTEDGLPQNSILSIVQSRDGYIWCSTQQGIVKFDGVKFYLILDDNKLVKPNVEMLGISCDTANTVWSLEENEGIREIQSGKEVKINYIPEQYKRKISSIYYSPKFGLFSTTAKHVLVTNYKKTVEYPVDPNNPLTFTYEDSSGVYFHSADCKLFQFTKNGFIPSSSPIKTRECFKYLKHFSKNGYVAVTSSGLYKSKNGKSSFIPIFNKFPQPDIRGLVEDADGTLWIATLNYGVFYVKGGTVSRITKKDGLTSDFASTLYVDRENNIWVGTYAGGLHKITRRNVTTFSSTDGLNNEFIFSVAETNNGDLWVATYGNGIVRITPEGKISEISTKHGLNAAVVRAILVDKKQRVWAAPYNGGLNIIDGTKVLNASEVFKVSDKLIHALLLAPDGKIYAGGSEGVHIFNDSGVKHIKNPKGVSDDFIRALVFDEKGTLWIGYNHSGLYRYLDGQFLHFGPESGMTTNAIRSLFQDSYGKLWVTTSEGLYLLDNNKFFHFKGIHELKQLLYQIIEDDNQNFWIPTNQGIVRIARKQLLEYSAGKLTEVPLTMFNKTDGLLSSECNGGNQPAAIRLQSGVIALPTLKGIAFINPNMLKKDVQFPPVSVNLLKGDDKNYFNNTNNITLPKGTSRIEIGFACLSFKDPQSIKLKYQLKPLDNTYTLLQGGRTIIYNHLPPGDYEFVLYTANDAGEWSSSPVRLAFTIEPYFFETYTFWFLFVLFLFSIGTILYFKRISTLKKRELQLEILVDQKTESLKLAKEDLEKSLQETLRNKHELLELNMQLTEANSVKTHLLDVAAHDLKNPLNAIKGFAQILLEDFENSGDRKKMLDNIKLASSHMLMIINDILHTSNIESGKLHLDLQLIDISYCLKKVILRNKFHAESKGQEIIFENSSELIAYTDERRTDEILDNLLSNAVKFSPLNSRIEVITDASESFVTIQFKDYGPGLSDADKSKLFGKFERLSATPTGGEVSTGLGLSIVKDLITILNGDVRVESTLGEGASFYIRFPRKPAN